MIAAALGLLAGAVAMPGVPVATAAEDCAGVWVVVDAREAGGPVTTRCVAGDPGSGFEALRGAGHTYSFVPRIPGMVCVLDGRPDPCNGAPADAYWSYWHAEVGGSWTYATRGAAERDPDPGGVEGWAFGAGDPPSVPPPSAPAEPTPAPEPEPTPAPQPAPEGDAAPENGGGSDDTSGDPSSADVPDRDDEEAAPDAVPDDTPAEDPTEDAPESAGRDDDATDIDPDTSPSEANPTGDGSDSDGAGDPRPAGDDEGDGVAGALATSAEEDGSIAGIVSAGALIVVLASGAAWQSSRRRRG